MQTFRVLVIAMVFFGAVGFGLSWYQTKGDVETANQQLATDQATLAQNTLQILQEKTLHRSYVTLASVYLRNRPSVESVEANFNTLVQRQASRHNVQFPGAEFGTVNGTVPTPAPTTPAPGSYTPLAMATPIARSRSAIVDLGGKLPGDPNVGRPAIDPTLFVRIPVAVRLDGSWPNIIATLQDISRDSVMMSIANPSISRQHNGDIELRVGLTLLDPALPLLSGFEREVNDPSSTPLTDTPLIKHPPLRMHPRRPLSPVHPHLPMTTKRQAAPRNNAVTTMHPTPTPTMHETPTPAMHATPTTTMHDTPTTIYTTTITTMHQTNTITARGATTR